MTELDTMKRAKMYMDKLAQGIDPITDRKVPEDSVLNQVRLARCFFYVSGILDQIIANGGTVGARQRTKPFTITPEQLARVQISETPVRILGLVDALYQAVGDPDMKKLNATVITNWLEQKGILTKETGPDGKFRRVPTEAGFRMGLSTQLRQGQQGEYLSVSYNTDAQRFVLSHLEEIMGEK